MVTKIPEKPFIVVDGSSYLFRAYYALPPLTNKVGLPTGAIYGVINMLRNLIEQYHPEQVAIVFDSKGKNFRHEAFPEYKANREEMPEELARQIPYVHEVIKAMGLPLIVVPGVEADDVIGTLAKQAAAAEKFTVISTGDKDMAQLVNNKVILINTMNNTIMDVEGVKEKFNVPPGKVIDYLTLMGDSVDNIPGVPKVGPKTAVKWVEQFGSLQGVIDNAEQISGKVGENLRAVVEKLPLYRNLIVIKTDVELEDKLEDLYLQQQDTATLKRIFAELEFKRWLRDLEEVVGGEFIANAVSSSIKAKAKTKSRGQAILAAGDGEQEKSSALPQAPRNHLNAVGEYQTVLTMPEFDLVLQQMEAKKIFALDTETTSLNYMDAKLVGVSICVVAGKAVYIPVAHDYPGAPTQLKTEVVLAKLQPLLADETNIVIGHNLKYDLGILANYGVNVVAKIYDTMLASYVLNSVSGKHSLDALAERVLNYTTISYEQVAGKGVKRKLFNEIDLQEATPYAAEDADITYRLYQEFLAELAVEPKLQKVLQEIELPLLRVILAIERNGVMIDVKALQQQSAGLEQRLLAIEKEIYALAGEEFNISSTKQLREVLFDRLGLPVLGKTPTGQPSTAEDVLEELAVEYSLPELILEYRSLSKLKSTYTDSLPEQVNKKTGRVHTSYHQAVTTTGRLSSSNPNLQNIPVRKEEGRKIRYAFIAPKGYKILSSDYSQIELRIMAHLSGDEGLLTAFKNKQDIHLATAAEVFGVEIDQVTREQRRHAKAINFGLIYGMSAFGLAKQLTISRADANRYITGYFVKFSKVKEFMDATRELAAKQGYVETLLGRRLYLPEINSKNMGRKKAAERAAINAPMQGGQADIIKLAMIKLQAWIEQGNIDARMIMQVHDELVFEVAEAQEELVKAKIVEIMMGVVKLKVDLEVGVGVGSNWGEAH